MSAQIADFFARLRVDATQFVSGLRNAKGEIVSLAPGLEKLGKSIIGSLANNESLIAVIAGIGIAAKKTIDETVAYGDELERVKRLTGLSAEESSKLVQVTDDLFISQDSLNQALTIAGKKYDVSINGLAKLSDEYNKLGTTQEKNAFAAQHFGKNYAEVVKLLEAGGDKIKEMAGNQPKGLIFSEADLMSIKVYKQEVDQLSDSWHALVLNVGKGLVGLFTGSTFKIQFRAQEIFKQENGKRFDVLQQDKFTEAQKRSWEAAREQATAEYAAAHGIDLASDAASNGQSSMEDLARAQETAAETAKRITAQYQQVLSLTFDIANTNKSYTDSLADMDKQEADLENQKKRLTYQWYQQQAAGKATTETFHEYTSQFADLAKQEQDLADQRAKAAEDQKKATAQRIYNMVQEGIASDGLTSGEFASLQDLAVVKGLITKADADQAITERKAADDYIDYINKKNGAQDSQIAKFDEVNGRMQTATGLLQNIKSYDGQSATFALNFVSNGSGVSGSYNPLGYVAPAGSTGGSSPDDRSGSSNVIHSNIRDSGGMGVPGQSYAIGTGAQPEIFTPTTSGNFTPANQWGKQVNVNISVASVRSQQDLDYLAQEVSRRVARM